MIKSFFALLLTASLFLSSFGVVVYRLQDPNFVVEQSRSVNLYGRLASNISQFLPTDQLKEMGLESADITEILKSGIGGEQFYEFVRTALNAYLPWFTGKTDSLSFSYGLQDVKQKLSVETSAKLLSKYNALPVCTAVQLRDWSFEEKLPTCQLASGTLKSKSINNLADQVATKLTEGIPDSISVNQASPQLLTMRINIALVFKTIYILWGITLLLTLLFLLIWRSSGLISLGVTFLFVGLLQIAFSLIGWDWIARNLGDYFSGSNEAKAVIPLIIDLVSVILGAMKTILGNISVGLFVFGVVLLIIGIFGKIHHGKQSLTSVK